MIPEGEQFSIGAMELENIILKAYFCDDRCYQSPKLSSADEIKNWLTGHEGPLILTPYGD
jgi:hypothetical protein